MSFWNYQFSLNGLVGQTITEIDARDTQIDFVLEDGRKVIFYHEQDCCESVWVEDVNGDWNDLIGTPILVAEERTEFEGGNYEHTTWTFYTFRTIKGSVDVRWYGNSSGYYSETVDIRVEQAR